MVADEVRVNMHILGTLMKSLLLVPYLKTAHVLLVLMKFFE